MTKEKWFDIYQKESMKFADSVMNEPTPEEWIKFRVRVQSFWDEMDKATEVYFFENPKEIK